MTRVKEEGVVGKKGKDLPRPFSSFPFPFPSPVVYFLALVPFHARPKMKTSCSSIFQRKCLRRRLQLVQLASHLGLG